MALSNTDLVTELYVGYFNRAPDPAGLQFWLNSLAAGATFNQIADSFSKSSEATALYPYLSLPGVVTPDSFVTSIYNNLLNRAPDDAGKAFWVNLLNTKQLTPGGVISAILGSVNQQVGTDDAKTIANKIAAGEYYVSTVATSNTPYTQDSAKNALAGVTLDAATVVASKAVVDSYVSGNSNLGTTYALTTGIDNVPGTNGNDVIIGDNSSAGQFTVQVADQINGGAGIDTLKLYSVATNTVFPTIKSVENIYLNNTTGGLDVSGKAGVVSLEADGIGTGQTFTVTTGQAVKLSNIANATTTTIAGNTPTSLGLTLNAAGVKGGGSATVDLSGTALTTANITAVGTDFVTLTNTGAALKTLNVDGAGVLKLDTALTSITTIDASKSTGGINVNSIGASNLTFTGSALADTLKIGASLTTADILNGGDGVDTLGVTAGATLVTGLQVTNFETLDIGGADSNANTYDLSKLAGITSLKVGAAIDATATSDVIVNNLAKGAGVTISASLGTAATDGLLVSVKDAGAGSPNDTIGITLDSATAVTTTGYLTVADIETVNLNSTSTGTSITHTLSIGNFANATTVNVNASTAGLTIGDINDAALVLFDASASAKAVSVTTGADTFTATSGVLFKGGAAADTINLTGADTGGAAGALDFIVDGKGGGDNITLSGAATAFSNVVISSATDSQAGVTSTGAAKFDTITNFQAATGATAQDHLDLSAFGFAAASQNIVTGSATINADGTLANAADAVNFFVSAGNKLGVTEVASGGNLFVYVDVNKDGNFDATADAMVKLVGVTAGNFDTTDIKWA